MSAINTGIKLLTDNGVPEDKATKLQEDLGFENEEQVRKYLKLEHLTAAGIKPIPAAEIMDKLKPAATVAPDAPHPSHEGVLPTVPDSESWLSALKAGGILKVDDSTVIAAVRVTLGLNTKLFDVPDRLVVEIEKFADESEEQVDLVKFNRIRKMVLRRSYGEIFEAIDGLDASFVSDKRKKQLIARINQYFWPAILTFDATLRGWIDEWERRSSNPQALLAGVSKLIGGGGIVSSRSTTAPDIGPVRDAAEAVNTACNKVFAGVGKAICAAVAYEANRVRDILAIPDLPAMIGVPNREMMLKKLEVDVPTTYPRLETALAQYVLGILKFSEVPEGNQATTYLDALMSVSTSITWNEIGGARGGMGIGESPSRGTPPRSPPSRGGDDGYGSPRGGRN